MGRVEVDERALEQHLFGALVEDLDRIGREAKSFVVRETPEETGHAKRSVFYVVIDERGNALAGDTVDGNGQRIPNHFPGAGDGTLRVIVGANAPYYLWIEIGANGVAGKQALARASELINERIRQARSER
jgi:hypothetical protein